MAPSRPFFPRDKPKSWVVAICAGLIALMVACPLIFLGHYLGWGWLFTGARMLFIGCWLLFVVMMFICLSRAISGRYKTLVDKDWREQAW